MFSKILSIDTPTDSEIVDRTKTGTPPRVLEQSLMKTTNYNVLYMGFTHTTHKNCMGNILMYFV